MRREGMLRVWGGESDIFGGGVGDEWMDGWGGVVEGGGVLEVGKYFGAAIQ